MRWPDSRHLHREKWIHHSLKIYHLIDSAHAMAERLHNIISDAVQHEDQYTGAFNALLLGMNRQMNSKLKGVEDASKQVAEGSANVSDAAQSLAEGANKRCSKIINDNEGIQKTAEQLENSYKEAERYATAEARQRKHGKLLWGQWLVSVRLLRVLATSFQRLKVLQARLTFFT